MEEKYYGKVEWNSTNNFGQAIELLIKPREEASRGFGYGLEVGRGDLGVEVAGQLYDSRG